MRKLSFCFFAQFMLLNSLSAQIFNIDTLQYNGNINKYINIVIMGDGYTASEQNDFIADATNYSNYIFTQTPFVNYSNFFNVFAIKVISPQSGVDHPVTANDCGSYSVPYSNVDTFFECSFDNSGVHRLILPQDTYNVGSVLVANFPDYDQMVIIANTPYHGASGGIYATVTASSSFGTFVHEIGHSFANLKDEYYPGDIFASEGPNMTQISYPTVIRWKNWLGDNGIGIYQHCCGGNSALWYRPHNNCRMRDSSQAFCSVCVEAIVEEIHNLVDPVVFHTQDLNIPSTNQYLDFKLLELMKPNPNTLKVEWQLDGSVIAQNVDSVEINQNNLSTGMHTLVATVTDTTAFIRVANHFTKHFSTVVWTIEKTGMGKIDFSSFENKISYAGYPNPSAHFFNIEFELRKKSKVFIQLLSLEGQLIQQVENKVVDGGKYSTIIDLGNLATGNYILAFKIGDMEFSQTIIKQ